jgi:stearoyl-CoA desaturase (delta-9 desaturase)
VLTSLVISLVVAFILVQVAILSTTIYLHRTATHGSLELHPSVEVFFRVTLWILTGLTTREWVAVHRKHHAFTDKEGDPHSPHLEGFWSVQLGNVFHYQRTACQQEVLDTFAKDIKNDWWEKTLFRHSQLGPMMGIVVLCATLGIGWGLLTATLHGIAYVFVLSSSINGLCHYYGYKNFENTATNIRSLALFTGGEGLHNNHHAHQRSPKFSLTASEIDPAWPIISLLIKLRLAKARKLISQEQES